MIDLGPGGQSIKGKIPESVGVACDDVDQEVVGAGDVKEPAYLGQPKHGGVKTVEHPAVVLSNLNGDQCLDTMGTYFLPDAEREALADKIGDVLYFKALRASKDGRNMMRRGIRTSFGGSAYDHTETSLGVE